MTIRDAGPADAGAAAHRFYEALVYRRTSHRLWLALHDR